MSKTETQREHGTHPVEWADTLMLLSVNGVARDLARLQAWAEKTALLYARAHLLKYSAEHPQRNCILCVCMGTAVLHVEYHVYGSTDSYQFCANENETTFGVCKKPPEFLNQLAALGEAAGFEYADWFGPIRMHAHHGVMLEELTDW